MTSFQSVLHLVNRRKFLFFGIIIIIGILAFLFRPKPPQPVPTQKVTRSTLTQSISITGKVAAKNIVDLTFPVVGKVTFLGVKEGDTVKQNQTIATLDSRSTLKSLQSTLLDYSKQRNTFDQTEENYQNRTPAQALNDAMKRILQNNQYDLDKSVKSVELQSLAQENSVLITPIGGIVTRADAKNAGINIAPTTIFEITDPSSLVFDMDVDEADIGKIQTGQTASIVIDAFPDDTIKMPVTYIDFASHTTSTGSNVFTVESSLPNTPAKYRVGMNGNAEIITAQKEQAIIIPLSSIVDNKYVYVKQGKVYEKRQVTTGLQNDTDSEITSGLSEGDEIVTEPSKIPKGQIRQ